MPMAFSPDSKTLLTVAPTDKTRMWDAATGQPDRLTLTHQGAVHSVAYSPDGKTVLAGSYDRQRTARMWDAATGKPIGRPFDASSGSSIPWRIAPMARPCSPGAPTGRRGCGTPPPAIRSVAPLTHQGIVYAVAYSPDGKTVLTGSADQTARLWDAATGSTDRLAFAASGSGLLRGV